MREKVRAMPFLKRFVRDPSASSQLSSLVLGAMLFFMALAALTLAIPGGPSYDPWAWIIWGREIASLDLDTTTGPSWKPLPILFTVPFSIFGEAAPDLWLLVARATGIGAVVAAGLLGHRLAGRTGAVCAGGFLLLTTPWFWHEVLVGFSEGAVVLCVFLAVERHLAGHQAQTFGLGVASGLLRPEAWPFLGLYAIWLLIGDRRRLKWIAPGLALLPALWLLPELWGSGSLFRAAERAQAVGPDSPALAARPAVAVVEGALGLLPAVVRVGLILAVGMLFLRLVPIRALVAARALALLALAWLAMVALMAEFGFSGIQRYLFVPAAIACVLGASGFAWPIRRLAASHTRPKVALAGAVTLTLLAALGTVRAFSGYPDLLNVVERREAITTDLEVAIRRSGGERRLEACGSLYATPFLTPHVAWVFERHLEDVSPTPRAPGVAMTTQLIPGEFIGPPLDNLGDQSERKRLGRTALWDIQAVCRGRRDSAGARR
jgi:hypothetical protein